MRTIPKLEFEKHLLNENQAYLGQRVGDILNALQDLSQNAKSMGTRQLVQNAETAVNHLRRILHSHWSKNEEKFLRTLQKVGVAIMRAIEEKDDLPSVVSSAASELEQLMGKLGTPINNLGSPGKGKEQDGDTDQSDIGVGPPQKQEKTKPQQQEAPQPQAPQAPVAAQPQMG